MVIAARTLDRSSPSPYPGTLADTMTAIRDAGGRALAVRCDLTSSPDRQRLVDEARQAFGPIDVLVNNAAASWAKPFEELSAKQYQVMFDVHVRSAFELAQLVGTRHACHRTRLDLEHDLSGGRPPGGSPLLRG